MEAQGEGLQYREGNASLQLHDVYFLTRILIYGIREETHPSLEGQSTLGLLAYYHYGGAPNVISDESFKIARIIDITT